MGKNLFIIFGIVLLVGIVGAFVYTNNNSNAGVNSSGGSGDLQEVTIGIKNYNYYPNTITVKVNQQVRIRLDSSVVGCYRSFNIAQLGLSKYLATPNDYLEFTPTERGTYTFTCSMGMGRGTLIVE